MEFRILGPLEITGSDGPIELGSAKLRALLALLLMRSGKAVSAARLIDDLWEGAPPRSAAGTLQSYISQLRKHLGSGVVQSGSGGYRLSFEGHTLDAAEFELAMDDAAGAGTADPSMASSRLRNALALWRGAAFADFEGAHWASAEAARLEGLRQIATEDLIEARLALGEHVRLVPELEARVDEHPLRERPWALLVLALYRCDRQADALRAFGRLREHLREELGIEPSRELAQLEHAILLQETELDWQSEPGTVAAYSTSASSGLPIGVVTFLLTDVVGSTVLWDEQPVAMSEALLTHDAFIADATSRHHGRLLKKRGEGDSAFAVFTRASDALHAALDVQRSGARQPWPAGVELSIRIAIHTGEAIERDGDYYGSAVNRAARLRGLADGGAILLSQATAELVRDSLPEEVRLTELGARPLAGLKRPEHVFAVDAPGIRAHVLDVVRLAPSSPGPQRLGTARAPLPTALATMDQISFVGREEELARLLDAWKLVQAGARRIVLIGGEAGIGKTRLAAEFAAHAYAEGGIVVLGRCDDGFGAPFKPFAEVIRALVAALPSATLGEWAERHSGDVAPITRVVPKRSRASGGSASGDPDSARLRLCEAVDALLGIAGATCPVLLILDDLHWADDSSLALLRYLARSSTGGPLLILGTFRDSDRKHQNTLAETLADLRRDHGVGRITLGGLDKDAIGTLLAAWVGHDTAPEFVEEMWRETEGNPFFIEEVLAHLVESGVLIQVDGVWTTAVPVHQLGIPEGVREVIDRRLAHLTTPARRTLATAAVMGREFDFELLTTIVGDVEDVLLDQLDEAADARLIAEDPQRIGRFAFSHALVRAALVDGLGTTRRTRLHQRVGEALEARFDGRLDEQLAQLAYHFSEAAAAASEKAVEYAYRASRQCLERYAFEESIAHIERGLRLLDVAEPGHEVRRAQFLLTLAEAEFHTLNKPGVKSAALQVADIARELGDVELLAGAALACRYIGRIGTVDTEVIAMCEEVLSRLDPGRRDVRAQVLATLVAHRAFGGEGRRTEQMATEAVALARQVDNPDTLALSLWARWQALVGAPNAFEDVELARELIQLGRVSGAAIHEVTGHHWHGICRLAIGDIAAFDEDLDGLDRLAARTHSPDIAAQCAQWRAMRALLNGRFDDAETSMNALIGHVKDDPNFLTAYASLLLWSRFEQGRLAEVRQQALAFVEENEQVSGFRAALVLIHRELGELEEAHALFDAITVDNLDGVPRDITWPTTLALLAEYVAHEVPGANVSRAIYDHLVPYAGQLIIIASAVACIGAADRYLGMLAANHGRYNEAHHHYTRALELEKRVGSAPLCVRTQYWKARLDAAVGSSVHTGRVQHALREVEVTAHRLGMAALAEQSRAAVEALPPAG